jgi:hypothetical protein
VHAGAWELDGSRATLVLVTEVAATMTTRVRSVAGLLGADRFEDPDNARTILMMAGGLVLLAVLVAVGTVWWWRTSEVEHPALGPLEVMGTRKWWKSDYAARRRGLEGARPPGAEREASDAEPVDLAALSRQEPRQFDDLAEDPSTDDGAALLDAGTLDALMAAISSDRQSQSEFVVEQLAATSTNGETSATHEATADEAPADEAITHDGEVELSGDEQDTGPAVVAAPVAAPADPLLPVQRTD